MSLLLVLVVSPILGVSTPTAGDEPELQPVLDFTPDFPVDSIDARDASASLETDADGRTWLRLELGDSAPWPGVTIHAPSETGWDFSEHARILFDVKNIGEFGVSVNLRIDTTSNDGREQTIQGFLEPGETKTISASIRRRLPESYEGKLFGMRGLPGGYFESSGLWEPDHVTKILIFIVSPDRSHTLLIDNIRLEGVAPLATLPPEFDESFFPMIDQFGQYAHADWPGKTHSVEDLHCMAAEEEAELAANPRPANFNQYGGWADGPKREATGRFRVEKVDGRFLTPMRPFELERPLTSAQQLTVASTSKWWFIDPDGCLFWSHGVDCVGPHAVTPISDRRHYYEGLPEPESEFAQFYGRGSWAPHGYYEGIGQYETYNYGAANLMMKFGEEWRTRDAENAHRRLPSWGMNTIANWSDQSIFLQKKTPYVVSIGYSSPKIEGSEGYWGKFPDPFAPEFESAVRRAMEGQKERTVDDPYCLGYFVDNELDWKDETSLATAALTSPPEQPAKLAVLEILRAKYDSIAKLNDVWGTDYESWDAVSESTTPPSAEGAEESVLYQDLVELYSVIAEQYFGVISDAVHEEAPEGLYLGCRFSNDNQTAVRAAAKYVDVISFNRYRPSVADLTLPEGVDIPVVIGEFHFGALDRGMLHTGLQPVEDQNARAAAYESYVRGALANPAIVGTHWFQYRSQATTGRGDGENYQIGFVDVCDTPYPEIVAASRRVGAVMYELRSGRQ